MADIAVAIPCPKCGAQLGDDGVFSEKCPSCGQTIAVSKCPSCTAEGLIVVRQKRQRVATCLSCDWTKVEQGLQEKSATRPTEVCTAEAVIKTVQGPPMTISSGNRKTCADCGNTDTPSARFCGNCGTEYPQNPQKSCPNCGRKIAKDSDFCGNCGHRQV